MAVNLHRPYEFGALRDLQMLVGTMSNRGAGIISSVPIYHNPAHIGAKLIDINSHINNHISSVPHQMRINK